MARLSLLALSCLALAGFAAATPAQEPLAPVATSDKWKWEDCGLPTDAIRIQSLSVSPDPPQAGQNLTVSVVGTAQSVIEEGAYTDVVVKLGLVKLLSRRFDVCEEARGANATIQCPVQEGTYTVEQTVALPKEVPPALFKIQVRGFTEAEDDMVCLNLEVDFRKKPFFW